MITRDTFSKHREPVSLDGPILLYDGLCGLCNRFVRFVLRHDSQKIFRFASLQSTFGRQILDRHGAPPSDLDTLYVVQTEPKQASTSEASRNVLSRSDAIRFVLQHLSPVWRLIGASLSLLPGPVRDWGYNVISRNRYRIFGRYESCPLPSPEVRSRFLDL